MDESQHDPQTDAPDDEPGAPEFGPGGYLPDRASRRARKIVLRAPMGIQWVIGALLVGVVVAVAGVVLLRDDAPAPPFVSLAGVVDPAAVEATTVTVPDAGSEVLVVGVGRPRVFALDGPAPDYCPESGLLERSGGEAWRVTGRGVGATESLAEHPSVVHDGALWVDPTRTLEPLEPDDGDAVPNACHP